MNPKQTIHLTTNKFTIIKNILQRFIPNYAVWVFGSRISDRYKKFSDLDLVIINYRSLDFKIYAQIVEAFDDSDLTFKVDLLEWASLSDSWHEKIQENYMVFPRG